MSNLALLSEFRFPKETLV